MEINFKESLKKLRREKNISQETLAKYLCITQQSVGKWERGEGFPDITLLPKIALYFNVSIDDLLNVGQARADEKLKEYEQEASRLGKIGDVDAEIELWEKAHIEFPNNHYIMDKLQSAIAVSCNWPFPKDKAERIIELSTRVFEESTKTELRESALFSLCWVYQSIGNIEKALYYADMGGNIHCCRQSLRASVLEGEDGIKEAQNCLLQFIFRASQEALNLANKNNSDEEIVSIQFSIDLLKLLFSDNNFGPYAFDMSWRYILLASAYAKKQNTEMALLALEECTKFSIMDALNKQGLYTAPMVNRLDYGDNISKNFKGNTCNVRIKEFNKGVNFRYLREHPKFQSLLKTLEEYSEKI
jgi:transcriptional regulator with XRE-family HTH domain